MDTIRAVFIGLEGERVHEKVIECPPPDVLVVAYSKPASVLQRLWEDGLTMDLYQEVEYVHHKAHELHEDGVESVALYIRRPEVET